MNNFQTILFGASVRPERMNARVISLVKNRLKAKGINSKIIDPIDWQFPLLNIPIHFYHNIDQAPKELCQLYDLLQHADSFLFTLPEYNRTIPPGLTNLLNYFPHSVFAYKPAGLICYSTDIGGQVGASHLRVMLNELGCIVAPHCTEINMVGYKINPNGSMKDDDDQVIEGIDLTIDQIQYLTNARKYYETHLKSELVLPKVHPYVSSYEKV